ncbi:MAG TPA: STAS/SEC14 domain-containing protein [Myxococcus sp.]|nr:STAS/SEC14 domain-containing protein [Myxococcus sp.]
MGGPVFQIEVDRQHAIVGFILDGYIRVDEMRCFVEDLKAATDSLLGRDIKIQADLRTFKPTSPEAADLMRQMQEYGLRSGVTRVAELVDSQIVTLQLNRIARESRTDRILRRFWHESTARQWLIHGDADMGMHPGMM